MPAVAPASSQPTIRDAVRVAQPPEGFAAVLSDVRSRHSGEASVTLAQMIGLAPRAPVAQAIATTPAPVGGPADHPLVEAASAYLGVPYLWGGTDPAKGLDCSGMIQRAFADLGIEVPRVSADQARAGVAVDGMGSARPGDLVFWAGQAGRPNHIGIYLGDGKMLHAPRTGEVVQVSALRSSPPDAIRRIV